MSETEKITQTKDIAGRPLTLETGFLARQADGAVLARYGDTMVLATVVSAESQMDDDYGMPLRVDYEERLYAGGIIKGSRWVKREGRPTDQAILNCRIIDRSIRPLFPKDFKDEVQIIVTVLSVDDVNDPVMLSLAAVSAAIKMSGIPWGGPLGAARIGQLDGQLVAHPEVKAMPLSALDLFVSGTRDQVIMVEMGGREIPREQVLKAIDLAQQEIGEILDLVDEFVQAAQEKLGVKFHPHEHELTEDQQKEQDLLAQVGEYIQAHFPSEILDTTNEKRQEIEEEYFEKIFVEFEGKTTKGKLKAEYEKAARQMMRKKVLETKKRADGRGLDEVRPITVEVGPLPRTHGSAIFQRGETQVLTVATLGSTSLEQLIESPRGEESKRYIHHYNFPPYSTGEVGRVGSPKRREIGHGALAERALEAVIPSEDEFPYTIRLVSEVTSSNGSTSMASTCGSTLALMDAGVPIKRPVAGIAMGLIKDDDDVLVLTDIMGIEDYYGDMDFKVAGTENGITALQMDVKVPGLTREILERALTQADEGRMFILGKMVEVIGEPRHDLSQYAPKIKTIRINPKKIGDLIGPGGKVIRALQEHTQTEIDVQEDGAVHVAGINLEGLERAVHQIELLTKEVVVGEEYEGKVTRILDFGAFVEILPGREGLVHVSELAPGFVKSVTDVVNEGDAVKVKVIGIDDQGRINLSRKALMAAATDAAYGSRPPANGGHKVYRMDRGNDRSGGRDRGYGGRGRGDRRQGDRRNDNRSSSSRPDHNRRGRD